MGAGPFLALGLLGAVALAASAASAKKGPPPSSGTHVLDANLPPQLERQVLGALSTATDPNSLLFLASQMDAMGYHLTAAALRARAAELGGPMQPVQPSQPSQPVPQQPPASAPTVIPPPGVINGGGGVAPAPIPIPVVPPAAVPVVPGVSGLDAGMDPQTRAAVMQALATETDPAKLSGFAAAIQAKYPIAAGLLLAKAAAMQLQQPTGPTIPVPPPQPPPPGPPQPVPQGPPSSAPLDVTQLAPGHSIQGLMSADQWSGVLTLLNEWLEDNHASSDPGVTTTDLSWYRDVVDDLQDPGNFALAVDALQAHANNNGYAIPPGLPGSFAGVLDGQTFASLLTYSASHGHAIPAALVPTAQAIQAALGGLPQGPAALPSAQPSIYTPPTADAAIAAHRAKPVALVPSVAPPAVAPALATIRDVQHALNLLGASPPLKEDGINGPKTIAAVKAFQTAHPPLAVDGVAGPQTKSALQHALAASGGQVQRPPVSPGAQIAPQVPGLARILAVAPPPAAPTLTTLKDVQHALNLLGATPSLVEDGINGPKTIAAVQTFQAAHPPLVVDGVAGTQTRAALQQALAMPALVAAKPLATAIHVASQAAPTAVPTAAPVPAPVTISTLKDVQHALNLLGASPPLVEDGINGPKSIAAVKAFQAAHPPLAVDGAAGPQTKAALQGALASTTFAAAGGASSWRLATNADVIRDGVAGRFAELLAQPVGSRTESETYNGRTWCFEVISHRTHPHLTTHAKDVVAYLAPPRLAA